MSKQSAGLGVIELTWLVVFLVLTFLSGFYCGKLLSWPLGAFGWFVGVPLGGAIVPFIVWSWASASHSQRRSD